MYTPEIEITAGFLGEVNKTGNQNYVLVEFDWSIHKKQNKTKNLHYSF